MTDLFVKIAKKKDNIVGKIISSIFSFLKFLTSDI